MRLRISPSALLICLVIIQSLPTLAAEKQEFKAAAEVVAELVSRRVEQLYAIDIRLKLTNDASVNQIASRIEEHIRDSNAPANLPGWMRDADLLSRWAVRRGELIRLYPSDPGALPDPKAERAGRPTVADMGRDADRVIEAVCAQVLRELRAFASPETTDDVQKPAIEVSHDGHDFSADDAVNLAASEHGLIHLRFQVSSQAGVRITKFQVKNAEEKVIDVYRRDQVKVKQDGSSPSLRVTQVAIPALPSQRFTVGIAADDAHGKNAEKNLQITVAPAFSGNLIAVFPPPEAEETWTPVVDPPTARTEVIPISHPMATALDSVVHVHYIMPELTGGEMTVNGSRFEVRPGYDPNSPLAVSSERGRSNLNFLAIAQRLRQLTHRHLVKYEMDDEPFSDSAWKTIYSAIQTLPQLVEQPDSVGLSATAVRALNGLPPGSDYDATRITQALSQPRLASVWSSLAKSVVQQESHLAIPHLLDTVVADLFKDRDGADKDETGPRFPSVDTTVQVSKELSQLLESNQLREAGIKVFDNALTNEIVFELPISVLPVEKECRFEHSWSSGGENDGGGVSVYLSGKGEAKAELRDAKLQVLYSVKQKTITYRAFSGTPNSPLQIDTQLNVAATTGLARFGLLDGEVSLPTNGPRGRDEAPSQLGWQTLVNVNQGGRFRVQDGAIFDVRVKTDLDPTSKLQIEARHGIEGLEPRSFQCTLSRMELALPAQGTVYELGLDSWRASLPSSFRELAEFSPANLPSIFNEMTGLVDRFFQDKKGETRLVPLAAGLSLHQTIAAGRTFREHFQRPISDAVSFEPWELAAGKHVTFEIFGERIRPEMAAPDGEMDVPNERLTSFQNAIRNALVKAFPDAPERYDAVSAQMYNARVFLLFRRNQVRRFRVNDEPWQVVHDLPGLASMSRLSGLLVGTEEQMNVSVRVGENEPDQVVFTMPDQVIRLNRPEGPLKARIGRLLPGGGLRDLHLSGEVEITPELHLPRIEWSWSLKHPASTTEVAAGKTLDEVFAQRDEWPRTREFLTSQLMNDPELGKVRVQLSNGAGDTVHLLAGITTVEQLGKLTLQQVHERIHAKISELGGVNATTESPFYPVGSRQPLGLRFVDPTNPKHRQPIDLEQQSRVTGQKSSTENFRIDVVRSETTKEIDSVGFRLGMMLGLLAVDNEDEGVLECAPLHGKTAADFVSVSFEDIKARLECELALTSRREQVDEPGLDSEPSTLRSTARLGVLELDLTTGEKLKQKIVAEYSVAGVKQLGFASFPSKFLAPLTFPDVNRNSLRFQISVSHAADFGIPAFVETPRLIIRFGDTGKPEIIVEGEQLKGLKDVSLIGFADHLRVDEVLAQEIRFGVPNASNDEDSHALVPRTIGDVRRYLESISDGFVTLEYSDDGLLMGLRRDVGGTALSEQDWVKLADGLTLLGFKAEESKPLLLGVEADYCEASLRPYKTTLIAALHRVHALLHAVEQGRLGQRIPGLSVSWLDSGEFSPALLALIAEMRAKGVTTLSEFTNQINQQDVLGQGGRVRFLFDDKVLIARVSWERSAHQEFAIDLPEIKLPGLSPARVSLRASDGQSRKSMRLANHLAAGIGIGIDLERNRAFVESKHTSVVGEAKADPRIQNVNLQAAVGPLVLRGKETEIKLEGVKATWQMPDMGEPGDGRSYLNEIVQDESNRDRLLSTFSLSGSLSLPNARDWKLGNLEIRGGEFPSLDIAKWNDDDFKNRFANWIGIQAKALALAPIDMKAIGLVSDALATDVKASLNREFAKLQLPIVGDRLDVSLDSIDQIAHAFADLGERDFRFDQDDVGKEVQRYLAAAFGRLAEITPVDSAFEDEYRFDVKLDLNESTKEVPLDLGLDGIGIRFSNAKVVLRSRLSFRTVLGVSKKNGVFLAPFKDGEKLSYPRVALTVSAKVNESLGEAELGPTTILVTAPSGLNQCEATKGESLRLAFQLPLAGAASKVDTPPLPDEVMRVDHLKLSSERIRVLGGLDLALRLETKQNERNLPRIRMGMNVACCFDKNGAAIPAERIVDCLDKDLKVSFHDVELHLGDIATGVLRPAVEKIDRISGPVRKLNEKLTTPLPGIGSLAGNLTLLDLIAAFSEDPKDAESVRKLMDALSRVSEFSARVDQLADSGWVSVSRESLRFEFKAADVRNPAKRGRLSFRQILARGGPSPARTSLADLPDANKLSTSMGSTDIVIPLLDDPANALRLFLGQDITLIGLRLPEMQFKFQYSQFFPIIGPVGARFGGEAGGSVRLAFGYDTYGLREESGGFTDGFYVADTTGFDGEGEDVPEITLHAGLFGAAEVNILIARAGAGGGVYIDVTFNLHDNNGDGKVRFREIRENWDLGPIHVFDVAGRIYGKVFAYYEIGFKVFGKFIRIAGGEYSEELTLASFQLNRPDSKELKFYRLDQGVLQFADSRVYKKRARIWAADGKVYASAVNANNESALEVESFVGVRKIELIGTDEANHFEIDSTVQVPVTLRGKGGSDTLIHRGPGPATIEGGDQNDTIQGGPGNDKLYGQGGNDHIVGDGGNDEIHGGDDNDTLVGGDGDDTLHGDIGMDVVQGGRGEDLLFGGEGTDRLRGGRDDDRIFGGSGSDVLAGEHGDDLLVGGPGRDTISGDEGSDVLIGASAAIESRTVEWAREQFLDGPHADSPVNGESPYVALLGLSDEGDQADELHGGPRADWLLGGAGNDILHGGSGADRIFGGVGEDQLFGEAGADKLWGGPDSDQLFGGEESDTLVGGGGDDHLYATTANPADQTKALEEHRIWGESPDAQGNIPADHVGNDLIIALGKGDNWIVASDGNNEIETGEGDDDVSAGIGNDVITDGGGSNVVRAGWGANVVTLNGNDGDNTVFAGVGFQTETQERRTTIRTQFDWSVAARQSDDKNTVHVKSKATNLVVTGNGNDEIRTADGNDTVFSLGGNDDVETGGGDDKVLAGTGDDVVNAGEGNDLIIGGKGNDSLRGGKGEDCLWGGSATDAVAEWKSAPNSDTDFDWFRAHFLTKTERKHPESLLRVSYTEIQKRQFAPTLKFEEYFRLTPTGPTIVPRRLSPQEGQMPSIAGKSNDGDDVLHGDEDSDWLFGGTGQDRLVGGDGSDYLDGGVGHDTAFGDFEDTAAVEGDDDVILGGANRDTLRGGAGNDHLYGGDDDDLLFGDATHADSGGQRLWGEGGADKLYAYAASTRSQGEAELSKEQEVLGDALVGGDGPDYLYGNLRRELLIGDSLGPGQGGEPDFIHGDYLDGPKYKRNTDAGRTGGADVLFGDQGSDQLFGGGSADFLFGGEDSDWLEGMDGPDILWGGSSVDLLILDVDSRYRVLQGDSFDGHGADRWEGDSQDDAVDILVVTGDKTFVGESSTVAEHDFIRLSSTSKDPRTLRVEYRSRDDAAGDEIARKNHFEVSWQDENMKPLVEQFQMLGLGGDDILKLDLSPESLAVLATSLDDSRPAINEATTRARLADRPSQASVIARPWVGVMSGGPGNDILIGSMGRDRIDGGPENDIAFGRNGDDRISGDFNKSGNRTQHDVLFAGQGNDDLFGGPGTNDLFAWSRVPDGYPVNAEVPWLSRLHGTGLLEFLPGHAGESPDFGVPVGISQPKRESGRVPRFEDTGINRMLGSEESDSLYGGTGIDLLYGNGGQDKLYTRNGDTFEDRKEVESNQWKAYAKSTNRVWYVGGSDGNDELTIDYVTNPRNPLFGRHVANFRTRGYYEPLVSGLDGLVASGASGRPLHEASSTASIVDSDYWIRRREDAENDKSTLELEFDTQVANGVKGIAQVRFDSERTLQHVNRDGDRVDEEVLAILVDGGAGNDNIRVGETVRKSVWIDAGDDNDTVVIEPQRSYLPDKSESLVEFASGSSDTEPRSTRNDHWTSRIELQTRWDGQTRRMLSRPFELNCSRSMLFRNLTIDSARRDAPDRDWYVLKGSSAGALIRVLSDEAVPLVGELYRISPSGAPIRLESMEFASENEVLRVPDESGPLLLLVYQNRSIPTIYDIEYRQAGHRDLTDHVASPIKLGVISHSRRLTGLSLSEKGGDDASDKFVMTIPVSLYECAVRVLNHDGKVLPRITVKSPFGQTWSVRDGEWVMPNTRLRSAEQYTVTISNDAAVPIDYELVIDVGRIRPQSRLDTLRDMQQAPDLGIPTRDLGELTRYMQVADDDLEATFATTASAQSRAADEFGRRWYAFQMPSPSSGRDTGIFLRKDPDVESEVQLVAQVFPAGDLSKAVATGRTDQDSGTLQIPLESLGKTVGETNQVVRIQANSVPLIDGTSKIAVPRIEIGFTRQGRKGLTRIPVAVDLNGISYSNLEALKEAVQRALADEATKTELFSKLHLAEVTVRDMRWLGFGAKDDTPEAKPSPRRQPALGRMLIEIGFVANSQLDDPRATEQDVPEVKVDLRGGELLGFAPDARGRAVSGLAARSYLLSVHAVIVQEPEKPGATAPAAKYALSFAEGLPSFPADDYSGEPTASVLQQLGLAREDLERIGTGVVEDLWDYQRFPIVTRRDAIFGGPGDDRLLGGSGEDWIFGGPGNDVLCGGRDLQASDILHGGDGDDLFQVLTDDWPILPSTGLRGDPASADQFLGGDGWDRVLYFGLNATPEGQTDVSKNFGRDFVMLGYDRFLGRYRIANVPWVAAGQGEAGRFASRDGLPLVHYAYFQTQDVEGTLVDTRGGMDIIHADPGYYFEPIRQSWGVSRGDVQAGAAAYEHLEIRGGSGADLIFGSSSNDTIYGQDHTDVIVGGEGDDRILGGAGDDLLVGGVVQGVPSAFHIDPRSARREQLRLAIEMARKNNNAEEREAAEQELSQLDDMPIADIAIAVLRSGASDSDVAKKYSRMLEYLSLRAMIEHGSPEESHSPKAMTGRDDSQLVRARQITDLTHPWPTVLGRPGKDYADASIFLSRQDMAPADRSNVVGWPLLTPNSVIDNATHQNEKPPTRLSRITDIGDFSGDGQPDYLISGEANTDAYVIFGPIRPDHLFHLEQGSTIDENTAGIDLRLRGKHWGFDVPVSSQAELDELLPYFQIKGRADLVLPYDLGEPVHGPLDLDGDGITEIGLIQHKDQSSDLQIIRSSGKLGRRVTPSARVSLNHGLVIDPERSQIKVICPSRRLAFTGPAVLMVYHGRMPLDANQKNIGAEFQLHLNLNAESIPPQNPTLRILRDAAATQAWLDGFSDDNSFGLQTLQENADAAPLHFAFAGDVNGDGHMDILAANPGYARMIDQELAIGRVYLLPGGRQVDRALDSDSSYIWEHLTLGQGVFSLGDLNGDGFDDFAIGAQERVAGTLKSEHSFYVFLGNSQLRGGDGGPRIHRSKKPENKRTILWHQREPGSLLVNPTMGVKWDKTNSAISARAGDFDGDGVQGIVYTIGQSLDSRAAASARATSTILFNEGSKFQSSVATMSEVSIDEKKVFLAHPEDAGEPRMDVCDLDGDGREDIISTQFHVEATDSGDARDLQIVFGNAREAVAEEVDADWLANHETPGLGIFLKEAATGSAFHSRSFQLPKVNAIKEVRELTKDGSLWRQTEDSVVKDITAAVSLEVGADIESVAELRLRANSDFTLHLEGNEPLSFKKDVVGVRLRTRGRQVWVSKRTGDGDYQTNTITLSLANGDQLLDVFVKGDIQEISSFTSWIVARWHQLRFAGDGQIGDQIAIQSMVPDGDSLEFPLWRYSRPQPKKRLGFTHDNRNFQINGGDETWHPFVEEHQVWMKKGRIVLEDANRHIFLAGDGADAFWHLDLSPLLAQIGSSSLRKADIRLKETQNFLKNLEIGLEVTESEPSRSRENPSRRHDAAGKSDHNRLSDTWEWDLTDELNAQLAAGVTAMEFRFKPNVAETPNEAEAPSIDLAGKRFELSFGAEIERQPGVQFDLYTADRRLIAKNRSIADIRRLPAGAYLIRAFDPFGESEHPLYDPEYDDRIHSELRYRFQIEAPKIGETDPRTDMDEIYGEDGNDVIVGSGSADRLFGGFGQDTFVAEESEVRDRGLYRPTVLETDSEIILDGDPAESLSMPLPNDDPEIDQYFYPFVGTDREVTGENSDAPTLLQLVAHELGLAFKNEAESGAPWRLRRKLRASDLTSLIHLDVTPLRRAWRERSTYEGKRGTIYRVDPQKPSFDLRKANDEDVSTTLTDEKAKLPVPTVAGTDPAFLRDGLLLAGLEYATNLEYLAAADMQIRNIAPLKPGIRDDRESHGQLGCVNLRYLDLDANPILLDMQGNAPSGAYEAPLSVLKELENLEFLSLDDAGLASADRAEDQYEFSVLKHLRWLSLNGQEKDSVTPPSGRYREIDDVAYKWVRSLDDGRIEARPIGEASVSLKRFDKQVWDNAPPLKAWEDLPSPDPWLSCLRDEIRYLRLSNRFVGDEVVQAVATLSKLRQLELRNNRVRDLSALAGRIRVVDDDEVRGRPELRNVTLSPPEYDHWAVVAASSAFNGSLRMLAPREEADAVFRFSSVDAGNYRVMISWPDGEWRARLGKKLRASIKNASVDERSWNISQTEKEPDVGRIVKIGSISWLVLEEVSLPGGNTEITLSAGDEEPGIIAIDAVALVQSDVLTELRRIDLSTTVKQPDTLNPIDDRSHELAIPLLETGLLEAESQEAKWVFERTIRTIRTGEDSAPPRILVSQDLNWPQLIPSGRTRRFVLAVGDAEPETSLEGNSLHVVAQDGEQLQVYLEVLRLRDGDWQRDDRRFELQFVLETKAMDDKPDKREAMEVEKWVDLNPLSPGALLVTAGKDFLGPVAVRMRIRDPKGRTATKWFEFDSGVAEYPADKPNLGDTK